MAFCSHFLMLSYRNLFVYLFIFSVFSLFSQEIDRSPDTCHDFTYSNLALEFILSDKKIVGLNEMTFKKECHIDTFVFYLSNQFIVDSVFLNNDRVLFSRFSDSIVVVDDFSGVDFFDFSIFYQGSPPIAQKPPWEGGFVWEKDDNGLDWVGVACQQEGAYLWWPNTEDLSDEPDSVKMSFLVEEPYDVVANGRLQNITTYGHKRSFEWFVNNPINNYNITVNIADYDHFNDTLMGQLGQLDLDFYVLPKNINIAKQHFVQVKPMLHVFEQLFGPYPFYEDGYKLVETPYVGMEHQSCISYGNNFKKGYLGRFPGNMDFDFIIIHETAHEWWGNNVSMKHRRDMWIHESFATYSEALYVEELYGFDEMVNYLNYQRKFIINKNPILDNAHYDTDMYYKGSWMLHTLRMILDDDVKFEDIKTIA